MKPSHKDDERTEPADHDQWIANLRWTFAVHALKIIVGFYCLGMTTMFFINMRDNNTVTVQANKDRFDIILRHLQEEKAEAEADKKNKEAERLDTVIKQLKEIK